MAVVRWVNFFCGSLLALTALMFLAALISNLPEYSVEPEDVWLSGLWMSFTGFLAGLCLTNGFHDKSPSSWLSIANGAALLVCGALQVLARDNAVTIVLLPLCAIGPGVALLASYFRAQSARS